MSAPVKTVLITGASAGFGAATARRFAASGWRIVVTGRRAERLQAMKDALGEQLHIAAFDMRDEAAMDAAIRDLPAAFAGVDLLVNNAGLALGTGPAQSCDLDQWRQMIDTNVTALTVMTRKLLPTLIARKGGIVNLGSIAAHYPYPGGNVYAATKAFVHMFTKGLRSDLAGSGVRVTVVEPGLCESEFTLVRTGGNQEAYDRLYAGANPIQPEDIAETIFWIANVPAHVNINVLEMMPVSQTWSALNVHRG